MLAWCSLLLHLHTSSTFSPLPFVRPVSLSHAASSTQRKVVPATCGRSSGRGGGGGRCRLRGMPPAGRSAERKPAGDRNLSLWHRSSTRSASAAAKGADTVVLTPATLLKRLEIIFPPATGAAAGPFTDGRGLRRDSETPAFPLSCPPLVMHDRLHPCCRPVPWECVVLRRVGASPQPGAAAITRCGGEGESGGEADILVHTTAAVYDVFVPSPFLFPDSAVSSGAVYIDRKYTIGSFKNARGRCRPRSHAAAFTTTTTPTAASGNTAATRPTWLQRVGILHHIPGLPEPMALTMSLRDYVSRLQHFSHEKGEQELHCMTSNGLNNRSIGVRSLRQRFLEAKEAQAREEGTESERQVVSDGSVGVWIVRPWRESVFFALRYNIGADHFEWVCRPQHSLFPHTATSAAAPAVDDGGGGGGLLYSERSPLLWTHEPLYRAARLLVSSQTVDARPPIKFSTVMYYCASGVSHTSSEKAVLVAQLLADDASGGHQESGVRLQPRLDAVGRAPGRRARLNQPQVQPHGCGRVAHLAAVWTPLPRSSHLLGGRRLTEDPKTLAEALKYGLLRILH